MKQLSGRVVSEVLFALGHWVSLPMCRFDWAWLYPVYNKLMIWSSDVQDWAGNDLPWTKETKQNEN